MKFARSAPARWQDAATKAQQGRAVTMGANDLGASTRWQHAVTRVVSSTQGGPGQTGRPIFGGVALVCVEAQNRNLILISSHFFKIEY